MPKADAVPNTPALLAHAHQFVDGPPRFMPIVGDAMEPTLSNGDFVAVVPVERFRCDGLYVIDSLGTPVVYRCSSDFNGGILVSPDNKRYSTWTFTRSQFDAAIIGQVFATCKVLDHTLIRTRITEPDGSTAIYEDE